MLSFCASFFIISLLSVDLPKKNEKGFAYPNQAVAARSTAGLTPATQMWLRQQLRAPSAEAASQELWKQLLFWSPAV